MMEIIFWTVSVIKLIFTSCAMNIKLEVAQKPKGLSGAPSAADGATGPCY